MTRTLRRAWLWLMHKLELGSILCDSCRFDHPRSCRNPDRPNATRCKDYQRR